MKVRRPADHLPWRVSETGSKVDAVASRCFYMIAMGKWPPGTRLPSVRSLESRWSVNRLTVLKAYGMLAARGLVDHKPNGSFYVADVPRGRDFTRDRMVLENLYEEVMAGIREETDLSPQGVLNMLARIGESKAREAPEAAFVECSRSQAADHAGEIEARLGVPVLPLSLDEVRGKKMAVPSHVRLVFTTSFHVDEIQPLKERGAEVVALPIEISPELLEDLSAAAEVTFVETAGDLARRTRKDAMYMMGIENPRVEIVPDIGEFLSANLRPGGGTRADHIYLVPQKEWERLDRGLKDHPQARAIECRLSDSAWGTVAAALRLPFGAAG